MSKFSKALEQAQRDRAMRLRGAPPSAPPAAPPPAPARAWTPVVPPPVSDRPDEPGSEAFVPETPRPAPRVSRRGAAITGEVEDHLVSLVSPSGLEAEQYRALRHMVELRHKNDNVSVIAVSSPGIGDGKTTTAINLAGALAQASDAAVLLVEADLRRPSIGQMLGFDGTRSLGLVDAILDPSCSLSSVVQPRPPFNLSVVLAGQVPPSPYEVLKSPRLGALLDEAREQYDYIIMDTPPLALVQDCRVVARWVDGVILVVAADQTPRALLEAALEVLDQAKVVGLVFNGFDNLTSGRHGRHYSGYVEASESESERGAFNRITQRVGSILRRGEGPARSKRSRDRSR